METKIYSSAGFLHACSAEELYVITRHWLSDIIFFEQEINFFQSLVQNYFLPSGERGFEKLLLYYPETYRQCRKTERCFKRQS